MLKFYYNTAPNPMKVALFLEESGLPYEPVPLWTPARASNTPIAAVVAAFQAPDTAKLSRSTNGPDLAPLA